MTTGNDEFKIDFENLPKPEDDYEGKDVPESQRQYLSPAEAAEYKARQHKVYIGPHQGQFIDRNEETQDHDVAFVDLPTAWIKDHIDHDPETGKKREIAETFSVNVEDEDTGELSSFNVEGYYHVPNHGPETKMYEDGVERRNRSEEAAEARKKGIKPLKHPKKEGASAKDVITTRRSAQLLNGERPVPASATDVYISNDRNRPVQAVYKDVNGKRVLIFTPKEAKRRRDVFWSYKRAATEDVEAILEIITAQIENTDDWNDSMRVIGLIGLMGFRHGTTGTARRLPANKREAANKDIPNTGQRTGIGAGSLIMSEVSRDKDSVTFKFMGKEDVPQEFTSTNSHVLAIVDSAQYRIGKDGKKVKKGKNDRLFESSSRTNIRTLRRFMQPSRDITITTDDESYESTSKSPVMKDFRTAIASRLAREHAKAYVEKQGKPKNAEDFKKFRNHVGSLVGETLGHKRTKKGEWVTEGSTSITSYIDPQIWEEYLPDEDKITKLLKIVDDLQKAKGKYKGRTGGITPDWTMKVPGEERDIDEWAEARKKKAEERQWGIKPVGGQPMAKTWVGSLNDKGFLSPLIKQVIGTQMWFVQDGVDYVATLGNEVVTTVEKATFTYNKPSVSYAPSGRNNHNTNRRSSGKQGERYQGDTIDDEEDDYNV